MILNNRYFLLFLILFLVIYPFYGQNAISFSFHQDLKLFAFDDEHGNKAGTLDATVRLNYEFKRDKVGYFVTGFELEKANIKDGYIRYGSFLGYAFNPVFDDFKMSIVPTIGLGNIRRRNQDSFSWSGVLQISYKLSDRIEISSLIQFIERSDLEIAYGTKVTRGSFFIGLEVYLFRFI